MNRNDVFPSKYLKAADLDGPTLLKMGHVTMEKLGEEQKPILYFQGDTKPMVLNKTNFNAIADEYGDETDDWAGQPIVLFEAMVDFQGKVGPAIRVRKPKPQKAAQKPAPKDEGEDIPF